MTMPSPEDVLQPNPKDHQFDMTAFDDDVKRREEAKREAVCGPAARWQAAQDFMVWAASQTTAPQMTPAARKAKELRLLDGIGKMFENKAADE
jgi:predicted flap endonuclease-1-like 5' DNA nuclease